MQLAGDKKENYMKVIGIIGFKKSGKTTLGVRLAKELGDMGHRVGVIKHAHEDINLADTDSSRYRAYSDFVAAVSPRESEIILKGKHSLEEALKYAEGDIVIVEGFKREKTYPKIVCLREKEERKDLFDGLEICTAGFGEGIADFNISDDDHVKAMARMAVERSFKLPDLDCGHCGFENCYDLARAVVAGKEDLSRCVSLAPPVTIKIAGEELPLNPYNTDLFRKTIQAMLSCLKGFKKGTVEITIP